MSGTYQTASGLVATLKREIEALEAELLKTKADLEEQRFHHAACLTIAEGQPGWENFPAKFEATREVKRLRAAYEKLRGTK